MAVDSYATNDSFENSSGNVNFSFNASTGEFDIVSDKLITKTIQIPDDTVYDIAAGEDLEKYDVFVLKGDVPNSFSGIFELDIADAKKTGKSFFFINETGDPARISAGNFSNTATNLLLKDRSSGFISIDESDDRFVQSYNFKPSIVEVTDDELPVWRPDSLPLGDLEIRVTANFNTDDTGGANQSDIGTIVFDLASAIDEAEEGKRVEIKNLSENAVMFQADKVSNPTFPPITIPPKSEVTLGEKNGRLIATGGSYFSAVTTVIDDVSDIGSFGISVFRTAKLGKYLYVSSGDELAIYDLETEQRVYETEQLDWDASGIKYLSFIKNDIVYASDEGSLDLRRIDLSNLNPSTGLAEDEVLIGRNDITNTDGLYINAITNQNNEEIVYFFDEVNNLIKYNYETDSITESDVGFKTTSGIRGYNEVTNAFIDGRKIYAYAPGSPSPDGKGFFFEYDTATDTKTYSYEIPTAEDNYGNLNQRRSEFRNKRYFGSGRIVDPFKRTETKVKPEKYSDVNTSSYYDGYNFYDTLKGGVGYFQKQESTSVYPFYVVESSNVAQPIEDFEFVGIYKGSFIFVDGSRIFKFDSGLPGKN
jgi:hypothetical protein